MESKASILVVDDEATVRLLLKTELKKAGYQVGLAIDAEEAIELMRSQRFQVAVVDKNLPTEDGIELLRRCKSLDTDMELILMTGYATIESALEAIQIGVFDYITKPFDYVPSVIHRISRAVERRTQRDDLRNLVVCLGESNREVAESMKKLQKTYLETAKAMSKILGMRNPGRNDENQKVQSLAVQLAAKLGVNAEEIGWLSLAALLKDVGKAGEIEEIIKKPQALEDEEYDQVKQFPEMGAKLLSPIPGLDPLAEIIRHQSEHYDGSGYPEGLSGTRISLAARILAVADSYVAMRSNRPFREAMNESDALEEILKCSGKQFDPDVVKTFVAFAADNQQNTEYNETQRKERNP